MRFTKLMPLGVALVAAGSLALPVAANAAPVNAITNISVVCQPDGNFQVTMTFSHRGPVEARIYDVIGGVRTDSAAAWFQGTGDDSFRGTLYGGQGAAVTIESHLLKRSGHHALVDAVTPVTTDAGTCVATPA